jgi:hypothetical protein
LRDVHLAVGVASCVSFPAPRSDSEEKVFVSLHAFRVWERLGLRVDR